MNKCFSSTRNYGEKIFHFFDFSEHLELRKINKKIKEIITRNFTTTLLYRESLRKELIIQIMEKIKCRELNERLSKLLYEISNFTSISVSNDAPAEILKLARLMLENTWSKRITEIKIDIGEKKNINFTRRINKFVNIKKIEFAKGGFPVFPRSIINNTYLLEIRLCFFICEQFDIICNFIKSNTCLLLTLRLDFVKKMTPMDLRKLAEALKINRTILHLWMEYCEMNEFGAKEISRGIKFNNTLQEIQFRSNNVKCSGMTYLCEALINHPSMKIVNFGSTGIKILGCEALSNMLKNNSSITDLCLNANSFGHQGVKILCEGLLVNKNLTKLSINDRLISVKGAFYLSKLLELNPHLQSLSVPYCSMEGKGMLHLARGLKKNSILTRLSLNDDIKIIGARYISHIFKNKFSSLQELLMWNDRISDEGSKYIFEALNNNSCLHTMELVNNSIGAIGAVFIAKCLKQNISLTKCDFHSNIMKDEGVKMILTSLKFNYTLRHLKLEENQTNTLFINKYLDFIKNINDLCEIKIK
jgi:Ran GTPase-activating protein (RanGAP) involved in mRNA processing and transport